MNTDANPNPVSTQNRFEIFVLLVFASFFTENQVQENTDIINAWM